MPGTPRCERVDVAALRALGFRPLCSIETRRRPVRTTASLAAFGHGDGVLPTLLDFRVIAEDFLESARDELAQTTDHHDI